jgi:hypothetical protein
MGFARAQAVLGLGGLAWGVFLMTGTGFWWWYAANFAYACLAGLAAARLGSGQSAWDLARAATALFVGVNGFVWAISVPFHLAHTGLTALTATLAGAPVILGAGQVAVLRKLRPSPPR